MFNDIWKIKELCYNSAKIIYRKIWIIIIIYAI